jgi:hypothetical protein
MEALFASIFFARLPTYQRKFQSFIKVYFMKRFFLLALSLAAQSCISVDMDIDPVIVDPPTYHSIGTDSIRSGEYIGLGHAEVYSKLQREMNLEHLNIVSNSVSTFDDLVVRLPLYNYLAFDYHPGSDQGVQIWMENRKVKSIYLNSGKKLGQWPERESEAIRVGENSKAVAEKLIKLQKRAKYNAIFEHTMLYVKDMQEAYDSRLVDTPQWYYTKEISSGRLNVYQIHFRERVVDYILVNKMQK